MGRRARKKNKKIIAMDTDSIWYKRNAWWGRFMRKSRANAQLGKLSLPDVKEPYNLEELFTPIVVDYGRELEQGIIRNVNDWHIGYNPIIDIRNSAFRESHDDEIVWFRNNHLKTGVCAICNTMLTNKFPDDYPDDWKFCCRCFEWTIKITRAHYLPSGDYLRTSVENNAVLKKIMDKITLVKGNGIIRKYC